MSDVLLLVHRLPYPPDKGDKIRSYHLLRQLRRRFRVHLGCFVDDPNDWQHVPAVEALCASTKIIALEKRLAYLKSATALFSGQALSIPYFFDEELAGWVNRTLSNHNVGYIIVYSSPMAQYVLHDALPDRYRVMDFVDVDSDKWHQYVRNTVWPMSRLYAREARLLARFERQVARSFDAVSLVTENEVELFNSVSPETREKHHVVANGVASRYFDPSRSYPDPYPEDDLPIVFTGMMNYKPNIDAVQWFARKVMPGILEKEPKATFWIVGAEPNRAVRHLGKLGGVAVTGRVPDIRPYLKHASIAVAPLRIARGIQNKVLEAMAMGCRVVCSSQAAAGLKSASDAPVAIATSDSEFTDLALQALSGGMEAEDREGIRRYVLENHDWGRNLNWFVRPALESPGKRMPAHAL